MSDDFDIIINHVAHGSGEQRIAALDVYSKQFEALMAAAAQAMQDDSNVIPFVAERIAGLGRKVRDVFEPLFLAASDDELKLMSALVLCRFGGQEAFPWLLGIASSPGPFQYDATRHLARMRVPAVRDVILDQLRSRALTEDDAISGLLDSWSMFGEALPEDLGSRLHSDDAPDGVKVTLASLKL
jgi:hypothetical protein